MIWMGFGSFIQEVLGFTPRGLRRCQGGQPTSIASVPHQRTFRRPAMVQKKPSNIRVSHKVSPYIETINNHAHFI